MAMWITNNPRLQGWLKASGHGLLAVSPGFAFKDKAFKEAEAEVIRQHPEETDPDSRTAYRLLTRPKIKPGQQARRAVVDPAITKTLELTSDLGTVLEGLKASIDRLPSTLERLIPYGGTPEPARLPPSVSRGLKLGFGILVLLLLSAIAARGQTVIFKDEGITRVRRAGGQVGIDFVGAGVSCSTNVAGITTCTIAGGAATGYQTIEDEGTPLTQRTVVNFIGGGVSCVDSGAPARTDCTVTSGAGATHQIDSVALTAQDPINFLDTSEFDWTNPAAGNLSLALKTASVADSKLAQITTASKVSGAAITLLSSLPVGAGDLPLANLPSHASTHQNAGGDEVATATAAANAIPKANASADLDPPWLITGAVTINRCLRVDATGNIVVHTGDCGGGANVDLLDGSVHQDTAAGTAVRGDVITVPVSGLWTRLALGGANNIFGSDGTDAAWEAATGTASPVRANNPLFPAQVRFTAIAAPGYAAGNLFYDSTDQAMVFHNDEADIALQIGQEGWVRVRNESGATITDGQVVYIDGIVSGLPSIALARADALSTAQAAGFATHDIEDLSNGFVTLYGVVRDINTTGLTDDIYLSATTAGGMVDNPPSDPNFVVPLGTVIETGAAGKVFVNVIAPRAMGGDGVAVSGNSIAVDLNATVDGVGLSSSLSGMEFTATGGLALLQGCIDNDIPKWTESTSLWGCAADVSGGSPSLNTITAAVGAATINSGDNAIVWNWSLTTASKIAFKIGENIASTAITDPILFNIATLATSTAHPFQVTSRGGTDGLRVGATDGVLIELGSGGVDFGALLNYPSACVNTFVRAILDTPTCNTVGTSDLAAGAADNTIIRDSAGFSVIGKSTTGSGDPADIVAADGTVLGRTAAGNLVFAQVATDQVANLAITYAKIQNISATDRLLGRDTAGAGSAEELTVSLGLSFTGSGGIRCDAASTTAVGCPEMAVASEVTTGTSTILAVTPDALAGSTFGQVEVQMVLFDFTTAVATGDGAYLFHIAEGSKLIGMDLISLTAAVVTVSSSGLPTVDVARCAPVATGNPCSGTVVDVLTTDLTIDVNEDSSFTAAAAFAINTANDDVVEDGMWRIDVDVAGTGTQGLIVTLIFQKP